MAIVSFWSGDKKETAQTLSMVALATYMSLEHNYKTLVIDATMGDDTLERCFFHPDDNQKLLKYMDTKKLDIASGTEGLMSAIASNKITPEIIPSYTRVVFVSNRLDVLVGLKTTKLKEHEKNIRLYPELLAAANKFYDLVIVDVTKTLHRQSTHDILNMSDVIMYTMSQNSRHIDNYIKHRDNLPELSRKNVIPILGSTNMYCKYNPKNVASYIKEKELTYILYNNAFLEAASDSRVREFFMQAKLSRKALDRNSQFVEAVSNSARVLIRKFEEIKYGRALHS